MKTMPTTAFLHDTPPGLEATAIRIENERIHFLGWTEDTPEFNVRKARRTIEIDPQTIVESPSLGCAISESEGYQSAMSTETYKSDEPLKELLSFVQPFRRCGQDEAEANDYEIIECKKGEMSFLCEIMKDGDYVVIEY